MYEFRHAFNISSLKESPSVSEDILCCRYSPDDTMICTSHYDGVFNCSNVHTGKLLYSLSSSKCNGTELQSTIPSFRFLPNYKDSKSGCVLLLSGSRISYWHVQTQQLLRAIDTTSKSNTETRANALYTLDVHSNGSSFICAGKDRIIRSYDVERGVLIREASESENCESMAHSSRIQCVKWISSDTFVSAGWDSTIQFFDLRVGRSTCHVSGMYVSGESIDSISSHQLAVGCYNHESPVQVLDLRNFTKADLDWPKRKDPLSGDYETCKVIGLSSKPQFFVACGNRGFQLFNSTTQQLIRREDEDIPDSSYKPSDEVWFSCHMNHSGTSFVLGGKKSHVIIYDYYSHTNSKF